MHDTLRSQSEILQLLSSSNFNITFKKNPDHD